MAVEAKRGCGYRKVGGLYLVGSGAGINCDRLPIELGICPCCGHGIKPSRGWTWVDLPMLVGGNHFSLVPLSELNSATAYFDCSCHPACPLCHHVVTIGRAGLLWVGEQFYPTVEDFATEARTLGVSRRINTIPHGFELGKTWVLFAHRKGVRKESGPVEPGALLPEAKYAPAIFRVWKPERIEKIVVESQRGTEEIDKLEKRGITPVYVPDNDPDHQGSAYDKSAEPTVPATPPLFPTEE